MSWKILVVLTVLFSPLLLVALLWVLTRVSRGRVQCRWSLLWRHFCWLLPCAQWYLLLFLAQGTHIGNYVVWRRSSEVPCGWSAIWPQSNHSLQALFPVGQLQADLSPDEQLRRVLRERLTLFCGECAGGDRERSRLLLAFRERFAGAGPLSDAVAERLRLADGGWAAGDFRNSGLLYAGVCDQLEQELRQRPMRDHASERFAELRHLVCEQQAVFNESVAESTSVAGELELALRGLSELEAESGRVVLEVQRQSAEHLAVAANLGGESGRECLLQRELDQLHEQREQLQQRRMRVEQLWAQRRL